MLFNITILIYPQYPYIVMLMIVKSIVSLMQ